MPATGAVRLIERAPALQESITEVQYRVATVDGRRPAVPADVLAAAASGALAQRRARRHPHPQGQGERGRSPSRAPAHRGRSRRRRAGARAHPVDATPWCAAREVLDALDRFTGTGAASASPSTACCELHNGSNAAARGWNRWPPTRSRPPSRRAHHERRNRCPTRRPRRRPHPRARPAAPAPLRPHHLIPHPLGPNRPPNRRADHRSPPNRQPGTDSPAESARARTICRIGRRIGPR